MGNEAESLAITEIKKENLVCTRNIQAVRILRANTDAKYRIASGRPHKPAVMLGRVTRTLYQENGVKRHENSPMLEYHAFNPLE